MHIKQIKFSISLFLFTFVIFLFTLKGFTTTVLADEDTTVETVATYNYNKVPADTLATIKDIMFIWLFMQEINLLPQYLPQYSYMEVENLRYNTVC